MNRRSFLRGTLGGLLAVFGAATIASDPVEAAPPKLAAKKRRRKKKKGRRKRKNRVILFLRRGRR